jgi:hypothetical protein
MRFWFYMRHDRPSHREQKRRLRRKGSIECPAPDTDRLLQPCEARFPYSRRERPPEGQGGSSHLRYSSSRADISRHSGFDRLGRMDAWLVALRLFPEPDLTATSAWWNCKDCMSSCVSHTTVVLEGAQANIGCCSNEPRFREHGRYGWLSSYKFHIALPDMLALD